MIGDRSRDSPTAWDDPSGRTDEPGLSSQQLRSGISAAATVRPVTTSLRLAADPFAHDGYWKDRH